MPTIKPRINVTLSPAAHKAITKLAARDDVPDATLAARLIETALELEEDVVWNSLASQRDTGGTYVSHDQAWQ